MAATASESTEQPTIGLARVSRPGRCGLLSLGGHVCACQTAQALPVHGMGSWTDCITFVIIFATCMAGLSQLYNWLKRAPLGFRREVAARGCAGSRATFATLAAWAKQQRLFKCGALHAGSVDGHAA